MKHRRLGLVPAAVDNPVYCADQEFDWADIADDVVQQAVAKVAIYSNPNGCRDSVTKLPLLDVSE